MKWYYDYEEGHYYITEPSTTGLSSVTRAFLGIVTKVLFIIVNLSDLYDAVVDLRLLDGDPLPAGWIVYDYFHHIFFRYYQK